MESTTNTNTTSTIQEIETKTWEKLDDSKVPQEDRIRGSLFGLAWGDAFGCPIEGWRETNIKSLYGNYTELPKEYNMEEISKQGVKTVKKLRPFGLHSDDTQQSLALLNCILRNNLSWDRKNWATYLKEGMKSKAFRGFGRNFTLAVANLNKGIAPEEASSPSAGGIGASMRIGPLGALLRHDEELLATAAFESSVMTHGTIISGACAFAVAYSVDGMDVETLRKILPGIVSNEEKKWLLEKPEWKLGRNDPHLISQTLRTIFTEKNLHNRWELRKFISENARPFLPPNMHKSHVNQGFSALGGIHGISMALLPDIHPQQVLSEIVVLGYDVDTVGAICGTILGARFGTSWIPKERLLDAERLEIYCRCLISQKKDNLEDWETYMQVEGKWTIFEKDYQRDLMKKYFPDSVKNENKLSKRQKEKKNKMKKKGLKFEKKNEKSESSEEEQAPIEEKEAPMEEEEEKTTTHGNAFEVLNTELDDIEGF